MAEAEEISLIIKECDVEWKINFASLLNDRICYSSASFSFEGESWYLVIWPNGRKEESTGFIDLRLRDCSSKDPPINLQSYFSLKTLKGTKEFKRYITSFSEDVRVHDVERFLSKTEFEKRQSEFLDSGFLTVVCTLKRLNSTGNATAECSHCNDPFDTEEISSHEKKCRIKCPECLEVFFLKKWQDHECSMSRTEDSQNMLHDFKRVLLSGDHSDAIIQVKDEEFRLHKVILSARCPYFDSMFKSNMKEASTGVVTIEDCEPDIFRSFIHFLYTGKIDNLSPENVCALYTTAEKYQEDKLQEECLHFMVNTLSVDSFCDYFALALKHDEKELFIKGVAFFITKWKGIAPSVKWQMFVKEYPIHANELFMKALSHFDK